MAARTRVQTSTNGELKDMTITGIGDTKDLAVTVEYIDAATATKYLGANFDNRRIRNGRVESYAQQMARGQWILTGDPIRFGLNTHLLDGQHRLLGVILANEAVPGITVPFLVIRDVPADAYRVLDSGLQRSPGDALGNDVKNVNVKAAAIRALIVIERGLDPRRSQALIQVTRVDIAEYYADHEGEIEAATVSGGRFIGKYGFNNANFSAWLAFILLGWSVNKSATSEFVEAVYTGENLTVGDPRLVLRNYLSQGKVRETKRGDHLGIYIKAWNAWMNGETRQKTHLKDLEPFPTMVKRRASIYARD